MDNRIVLYAIITAMNVRRFKITVFPAKVLVVEMMRLFVSIKIFL